MHPATCRIWWWTRFWIRRCTSGGRMKEICFFWNYATDYWLAIWNSSATSTVHPNVLKFVPGRFLARNFHWGQQALLSCFHGRNTMQKFWCKILFFVRTSSAWLEAVEYYSCMKIMLEWVHVGVHLLLSGMPWRQKLLMKFLMVPWWLFYFSLKCSFLKPILKCWNAVGYVCKSVLFKQ